MTTAEGEAVSLPVAERLVDPQREEQFTRSEGRREAAEREGQEVGPSATFALVGAYRGPRAKNRCPTSNVIFSLNWYVSPVPTCQANVVTAL